MDTRQLALTGGQTVTALVLANNPSRTAEITHIADSLAGVFGAQEVTGELLTELTLRLALRFGLEPGDAGLMSGAVLGMWVAIRPAFGDGPIIATDPRVNEAIEAFAEGMRNAVKTHQRALELAGAGG